MQTRKDTHLITVGGVPQNGDSLAFPNNAARFSSVNDIAGLTLHTVSFTDEAVGQPPHLLTGEALTVRTINGGNGRISSLHAPFTGGMDVADGQVQLNAPSPLGARLTQRQASARSRRVA